MKHLLIIAAFLLPFAAFAASEDSTPPTSTETTTTCKNGKVWSEQAKKCVTAQDSRLEDDALYRAARELAYAGQYDNALVVLAAMSDPLDDRVLTYKGFVARKTGDIALGNAYYAQAIARNPDNLLARSYMGQGFVESGDLDAARTQLAQIRMRQGRGTWAEVSLRLAIEGGAGYSY